MNKDKNSITTAWRELMNRPMSRKQFLGVLTFGMFALIGLGPLVKALKDSTTAQGDENPVYGGRQTAPAPKKQA